MVVTREIQPLPPEAFLVGRNRKVEKEKKKRGTKRYYSRMDSRLVCERACIAVFL